MRQEDGAGEMGEETTLEGDTLLTATDAQQRKTLVKGTCLSEGREGLGNDRAEY